MNSICCHGDGDGQFNDPNDIALPGWSRKFVCVSDTNNSCVQVFDCMGQFLSVFSATLKQLNHPIGICVSSDQHVYTCM